MVQHRKVTADDVEQRLDNFLIRTLKGVPRTHVYKIIRSGEVRVNGRRAQAKYRLQIDDEIRIPPVRVRTEVPIRDNQRMQSSIVSEVLFEDEQLIAINKPQGVAVHGGTSVSSGIVEQLRLLQGNPRIELVHRLDRETSGCLLLAKKPRVLKELQREFRARSVKKIYQLIVYGQWPKHARVVTDRLRRYETHWGERRVKVASDGQAARTDFEILEADEHHSRLGTSKATHFRSKLAWICNVCVPEESPTSAR